MRLYGFENKPANFITRENLEAEIRDVSYRAILGFGIILGLSRSEILARFSYTNSLLSASLAQVHVP
jgi:hypothetical protein